MQLDFTKWCMRCETYKWRYEFSKNRNRPDGLAHWCKNCMKVYLSARYRAKKAEYSAKAKAYREHNAEKLRAYREKNKARRAQVFREWAEKNRARRVEVQQRRYFRKLATYQESYARQQIFERDKWICQICLKPVGGDPTIDHIIPLSRGGHDAPDNVQLAHRVCNSRKGVAM